MAGQDKFLVYWSLENLDVPSHDFVDANLQSSDDKDGTAVRSVEDYANARAYLRFLKGEGGGEAGVSDDGDACEGPIDENTLCEACSLRLEQETKEINYVAVGINTPLLVGLQEESEPGCVNLTPIAEHIWAQEPSFYPKLSADGMGFLSQVAHICLYAKIHDCQNELCTHLRGIMEHSAPNADGWPVFREWAIVAMACQANHRENWHLPDGPEGSLAKDGHTHIAGAVAGLAMALAECSRPCYESTHFKNHLDGEVEANDEGNPVPLLEQVETLIYWMVSIQYAHAVGPDRFGRWGGNAISNSVAIQPQRAFERLQRLTCCKNRFWSFIDACDRKDAELPSVVSFLEQMEGRFPSEAEQKNHADCGPKMCQRATVNSTKTKQMHVCSDEENCGFVQFDLETLHEAIDSSSRTAWVCSDGDQVPLAEKGTGYVAISHVWSDGTGVGLSQDSDGQRLVNRCLWEFWNREAAMVGGVAVWWDTVSVPTESKRRSKALESLHRNYSGAECTIVHDKELARMTYTPDGMPCVALVLSNWFSRGWTALELQMSKSIKVLFKNDEGEVVPFDLDNEILASSPSSSHPAHWMATSWIQRLRAPVNDVGDILHTLGSRYSSWPRDKTIIAALLAGVPNSDFGQDEVEITKSILNYLGKIPSHCLLHGQATIKATGPWSWCTSSLFEMPIAPPIDVESRKMSDLLSLLDLSDGRVSGYWKYRKVSYQDATALPLYGSDLSSRMKARIALRGKRECLLLRSTANAPPEEPALLVTVLGAETDNSQKPALACRYVGAVVEVNPVAQSEWRVENIILGYNEETEEELSGSDALSGQVVPSYLQDSEARTQPRENQVEIRQKKEAEAWMMDAYEYDEWINHGFDWSSDQALVDIPRRQQLIEAVVVGDLEAYHYLFKLVAAENGQLDPDLAEDLFQRSSEPSIRPAIINGLWSLGDFHLGNSALVEARNAYTRAYNVYEAYSEENPADQQLPSYTNAMLQYQLGLVDLLDGNREEATESFEAVVRHSDERSSGQRLNFLRRDRRSQNSRTAREKRERRSQYMVYRPADNEGWYFIKRSAMGALILISIEVEGSQGDYDPEVNAAADYFLKSLSPDDRKYLAGKHGFSVLTRNLRVLQEGYNVSHERENWDANDLEWSIWVLQRALRGFDRLFRKKHILCCVSALCLGIVLLIDAQYSEACSQFDRARDDLKKLLPELPEGDDQPEWAFAQIADSYKQVAEAYLEEERAQYGEI